MRSRSARSAPSRRRPAWPGPSACSASAAMLGSASQRFDQARVALRMEEEPPRRASDPEGLHRGGDRAGERRGGHGEVEHLAVPVKDLRRGGQGADHRVVGIEHIDGAPPDLRRRRRPDVRAERARQELRAEAYAEHRHLPVERLGDPADLGRQSGEPVGVVDAHRPAHEHRAGHLAGRGQRRRARRLARSRGGADVRHRHPQEWKGGERVTDSVRSLPRNVLHDEDRRRAGAHG